MTTLYLIRHAQSLVSPDVHHTDWPLSDTGSRQADALIHLLTPLDIAHLYSSPFPRCRDTIGPFADHHEIAPNFVEDLRERLFSHGFVPDFHKLWSRSWADFHFALPGCESSHMAQQRFVTAVAGIADTHPSENVAICAHANVIALFLNHVEPSFHQEEAEAIGNPHILKVQATNEGFAWDETFSLAGLAEVSTTDNTISAEE